MVKVRRQWLFILIAGFVGITSVLGFAGASGPFSPALSLALSNPNPSANSNVATVTSLASGNPALGNWSLLLPAGWGVSRDTQVPYNDIVAQGSMSVDVDCDGSIQNYGPFNLTNLPADPDVIGEWKGQITSWWSLLVSVDRESGNPVNMSADLVSFSQFHPLCAPQTFSLTILGRSSPGNAPVLTNPGTASTYTWTGSFVSLGAQYAASVPVAVCVGASCPTPAPTPSPTSAPADQDGDGVPDFLDNCPAWANPGQALPNWIVPAGDDDCDGYPNTVKAGARASETFIGTAATQQCAATPASGDEPLPDAWPVDFNDNQLVNGADWLAFNLAFGSQVPEPPYTARLDLNADGIINGSDMLQLNPFFYKRCTP